MEKIKYKLSAWNLVPINETHFETTYTTNDPYFAGVVTLGSELAKKLKQKCLDKCLRVSDWKAIIDGNYESLTKHLHYPDRLN